jgi:hypothetical protein
MCWRRLTTISLSTATTPLVTSSRHPDERLKQAVKALEGINKALQQVVRSLPSAREDREAARRQHAALVEKLVKTQPHRGAETEA